MLMRRLMSGFWSWGLLIGLLIGLALASAACGEEVPSESVAQQIEEQEQASTERQGTPQSAQQETVIDSNQVQAEPQQASETEQGRQTAAAASEQESQSATETSDARNDQRGDAQQAAAESAAHGRQDQQQMTAEESVPEGTRLITLFGDLTEIVYALGVEEYLVARDASSIYPPAAEDLPNLGFAGGLNAEAILEFEPTLVLGTPMAGPPGVLEQLERAGVEVLVIDDLIGLDAPQIKIRFVGEALSIPQRADALALDVERRTAAVITAAQNDEPLRVLHVYIRRGGLQLVSGEGNVAQTIIEAAGGIDAAAEAGIVGWQTLTPEALVAADPDVYLVMDRGLSVVGGVEGLLEIPGMAETKAGRGQHVISMADLYLLGFGPRLPEAIADLAQFLGEIQEQVLERD